MLQFVRAEFERLRCLPGRYGLIKEATELHYRNFRIQCFNALPTLGCTDIRMSFMAKIDNIFATVGLLFDLTLGLKIR